MQQVFCRQHESLLSISFFLHKPLRRKQFICGGHCYKVGDDVAVPAFGLSISIDCVCFVSWLMMLSSAIPCVSVVIFSPLFDIFSSQIFGFSF
jgi:hypothetical protein